MKLGDEFMHIEAERVRVCVDLTQGHIDLSIRTDASEDLYKWVNAPLSHGVGLALLAPLHISKIGYVEEGLINVNDPITLI